MRQPIPHPATPVLLALAGAVVLGTFLAAGPASAQGGARAQPGAAGGSLFQQVIGQPTGQNGYEELLRAADVLRTSRLFREVEPAAPGQAALEQKRLALADRPVRQALELIRQGLAKPVFSPRKEPLTEPLGPELPGFKSLSRLLTMQQYVHLADGRVGDAISVARTSLRLGHAAQTDSLVAGLVGVSISTAGVRTLGAHLDQLSARDCELLYAVCQEWLKRPNPLRRIIQAESRLAQANLMRTNGELSTQGADKEKATAAFLDASKKLEAFFQKHLAELEKPYYLRTSAAEESDGSIGATFAQLLEPAVKSAWTAYAKEETYVRLLACHCVIRRYRWENDRLPESLQKVELGDLAQDPFTGQPFKYTVQGRRYTLTSAGPAAQANDPNAVDGRVPISLGPGS